MLELKEVSFYYEESHKILDRISLSFPSCGLIMIEGESGSGKSTLLSLLHHEKEAKEGNILFNNRSLNQMNEQEIMDYRLFSCGIIYQDYGLFPHLSIQENLNMVLTVLNRKENIQELLKKVGLHISPETNVDVLSGGEKQRIAILRGMLFSSPVLLLDEPTSSLDDQNAFEIMELLKKLSLSRLIIVVTHDHRMIEQYSDEHYHMGNGCLTLIKKKEACKFFSYKKKTKRRRFSYRTYLKRRLESKKKRTILMLSFLSMSVFVGSFSTILMENMKEDMTSSFSRFVHGNEIQMVVKDEKTHDERFSLNKEELSALKSENSDIDIMYFYEEDFSYAFPNRDEFRIFSLAGYPLLKGFKMETLNRFKLLKEVETYPTLSSLENDEVVIGMNNQRLNEICDAIKIQASYESLGNYLKRNPLSLGIQVKNIDWDYEDEQLLLIKGVVKSKEPMIYHTNPYFNEYMLEERMRLRSTLSWYEEVEYPWIFHKRSVIHTQTTLRNSFSSLTLNRYLFDERKEENSYFISKNDKSYISSYDLTRIASYQEDVIGIREGSEKGYQIYTNTLLHGLAGILMVDQDLDALYQKEEKWQLENRLDSNLLFHSVLYPSSQTLTLYPSKEGVCISSSLASKRKLKVGMPLYYLYSYNEQLYQGEWIIQGINKEKEDILYLSDEEIQTMLLQNQITTSSYLKATSALIYVKHSSKISKIIDQLTSLYPEYSFSSPSYEFLTSLEKTSSSIQKGLSLFSLWMMIFSSFLFSVIHALFLYECEKDAHRIEVLGLDRNVKKKLSFYLHFIFFLLSISLSFVCLIIMSLLGNTSFFKNQFSLSFHMNLQSLSSYMLFSLVLYLVTFLMTRSIKIKKAKKVIIKN